MTPEICVTVGTRPGIIMMAPIIHELERQGVAHYVIHTGQHYSPEMDTELFEDLSLREPEFKIDGVAAETTHATQTARMMVGCESAFVERRPALVLVNGDANTNLASALAARKLGISLAHSEAGERSYDWRMPEEHNRRMMDHISELLFATNDKASVTLEGENVWGQVHVTGNTIVDASLNHAEIALQQSTILDDSGIEANTYLLLTTHREENVDDPARLAAILAGVRTASRDLGLPVVFPVHPRTRKNLGAFGLEGELGDQFVPLPAVRYLDFLRLLTSARLVVTDSGGVQQEAFIHERPTVTVRDNTEWTETLDGGGNRLGGADDALRITQAILDADRDHDIVWSKAFGDGTAAAEIVRHCVDFVSR